MLRRWFRKASAPVTEESEDSTEIEVVQDLPVELIRIGIPPELGFLFIDVSALDIRRALDGWKWIGLQGLTAISVSAFGEVFFRAADGSVVYLDTIEGRLARIAESVADLTAQLQERGRRNELLLARTVLDARTSGLLLEAGECYDFEIAPILGGKMTADKLEKLSFVVKVHIAGQLHEQVRDLPPGTRISKVTFSD